LEGCWPNARGQDLTVNGKIQQTAISAEMNQAKKKGPCGSEIHIDTSMGVMQIFGNNSGQRKITCKNPPELVLVSTA
jgi:hypothetical protein